MVELRGSFAPIPVPFDDHENIDFQALERNLHTWIASELDGVVMPGSNSEAPYITDAERLEIWRLVGDVMAGSGKHFIAGSGQETTRATIEQTLLAAKAGAVATLVVPPNYYKGQMTHTVLMAHYIALAEASPIPVFVYNVPQFSGIDFALETLVELADHPNIMGIKDSSSNILKMGSLLAKRPKFIVFAGTGGAVLPFLSIGSVGNITALSNFGVAPIKKIMRAFAEGDLDDARRTQRAIMALNTSVTGKYGIPGLKYAMGKCGLYGGPSRKPLLPLGEDAKAQIDGQMEALRDLELL